MPDITIYRARRILTMNPSRPEATHVAVRDGRILGAGPLDDVVARFVELFLVEVGVGVDEVGHGIMLAPSAGFARNPSNKSMA